MYTFRFLFFCAIFFPTCLFAQTNEGSISGRVTDPSDNTPVAYASLVLKVSGDSVNLFSTSSDEKGEFLFSNVPYNVYTLTVSVLGYTRVEKDSIRLTAENPNRSALEIALLKADYELEGALIEAEKNYMEMSTDMKVYNVGKDIFSKGGTATDVLSNIPSVVVDIDRNISLRGSENVTVWIDGKPSSMTGMSRQAVLDNIPASLIERIEVITNPSAKYDPDGTAGIINIVLKKDQKEGYNGNVNFSVGTFHKYNAGISMNYRNKWVNLYGSYSGQYNQFSSWGVSSRENTQDTIRFLNQRSVGRNLGFSQNGRVGADFSIDNKNTIGVSGGINHRISWRADSTTYTFLDSNQQILNYNNRNSPEYELNLGYDVNAFYKRIFKNEKQTLNLDFTWSQNMARESMDASQRFYIGNMPSPLLPSVFQRTSTPQMNSVLTAMLDYVQPIKTKHVLELGAKFISRYADIDFTNTYADSTLIYVKDTNTSNQFVYDEQVLAGYANYRGTYGKVGITAGIRVEQAFTTSRQITTQEDFENNYFSFFPTAGISYKFKQGFDISLNYSRRINRPSIRNLNPFPDYDDPYNLMKGNPYILPEYVNSAELSVFRIFKPLTLSGTVYFRHTSGAFTRFRTLDTTGIITTTFSNLGNNYNYGAEFVVTTVVKQIWKMMLTGNVYGADLDGTQLQPGLRTRQIGGSMRFTSGVSLPLNFEVNLAYSLMAPVMSVQGRIRPVQSLDLALQKSFLNNALSISLRVSDIFNTRKWSMISEGEGFYQDFERKRESRVGYFSLTYKFGNLRGDTKSGRRNSGGGGGNEMMEEM